MIVLLLCLLTIEKIAFYIISLGGNMISSFEGIWRVERYQQGWPKCTDQMRIGERITEFESSSKCHGSKKRTKFRCTYRRKCDACSRKGELEKECEKNLFKKRTQVCRRRLEEKVQVSIA